MNNTKERVLVIGGAGYLGSVLVEELLQHGYLVKILDSFIYGTKSIEHIKNDKRVEIIRGDIRNIETVNSSVNGVGSVILLAAVVGDPASVSRPEQTIETNYLASQVVASACKLKGIKIFLYASTCSVYGYDHKILNESAPLNPLSLYARTKIYSEESIMEMMDEDFAPTVMRMSTLYGYSPRMRFDLVVNTMTMTAFLEKQIKVFGGEQWRPLLHVKDAANAYVQVLESNIDLIRGKIYNVGSEEQNYKIKDVANLVQKTLQDRNNSQIPITSEATSTDSRDYRVSFKKIQKELGFHVKHTVGEGAGEIYEKLYTSSIKDPRQKVYYNHYFDPSEELVG